MLCSIGGRSAVAELPLGIKISGFFSWFFWRTVYLVKLPSLSQQVGVGASWFLNLLFPPGLASVRVDQLRHVGRAHYASGDFIFREGDPACDFYVIEDGQVEILSSDGSGDRLALLGRGDFFGEEAIVHGRNRQHPCRALTDSEIMVFGKDIFTEMTAHLTPLNNAIANALTRRNSLWRTSSDARGIVQDIPLMSLVEPLDGRMLNPESVVREVIDTINDNRFDVCFVADEQRHLLGIVTRSDLMRSVETAASSPEDYLQHVRVKDIMVPSPLKVCADDSTFSAVSSMREHGFTRLPVVESSTNNVLKGYLRIEHIMQSVAQKLLGNKAA